MLKLSRYVLYDILRSKVILAYTLFLFIVSISMFQMEENSSKAMLSLLNIVLIVLPLVSLIFTTIHYYNSYEFIELMSSQPMSRTRILLSEFAGVSLSLLSAFFIGVGIPASSLGLLLESCLGAAAFDTAFVNRAGLPRARHLHIGGGFLDQRGNVHQTDAVVAHGLNILARISRRIFLPMVQRRFEMAHGGGLLRGVAVFIVERQRTGSANLGRVIKPKL